MWRLWILVPVLHAWGTCVGPIDRCLCAHTCLLQGQLTLSHLGREPSKASPYQKQQGASQCPSRVAARCPACREAPSGRPHGLPVTGHTERKPDAGGQPQAQQLPQRKEGRHFPDRHPPVALLVPGCSRPLVQSHFSAGHLP